MLNKEYPAPNPTGRNLLVSLLFGAFISFFLIFFEPFDINISKGTHTIASLLFFGLITASILVLFLYLLPLFFPKVFADVHWKVKHQIIFCSLMLFVIATLNGLYTNYINSLSFSWSNYWWIIHRTFVLGSIPFSFFILIDYRRRDSLHKEEARSILEGKDENKQVQKADAFTISTDLKNETFTFEDRNFSHAVAVGNYTDLYFLDAGQLTCDTHRISLSSFEDQLHSSILKRCHRSYLVNMSKVADVSGNAQGLKLRLADGESVIPVSRSYIPTIKNFFSESV